MNFANLLDLTAKINNKLRVRFSTSYPQDMNDEVLHTMARHENICKHIHLPVQSGSTRILDLMKRGYSQEWYLSRIDAIKRIITDLSEKGIGILITDHNVRDTLEITSRSYIINLGEILAEGTEEQLLVNTQAREIYLGKDFQM